MTTGGPGPRIRNGYWESVEAANEGRHAARRPKATAVRPALAFAVLFLCLASSSPARAEKPDIGLYKGKVVYLDFWASWCAPCRLSFPWMNALMASYGAKGLVVVAVNLDHDHDLAQGFLHELRPRFPILYDPNGSLASDYDVKAMPTAILIDRDGRPRNTHAGFFQDQEDQYRAEIEAALDAKGP